jgi:TPR repeat protein
MQSRDFAKASAYRRRGEFGAAARLLKTCVKRGERHAYSALGNLYRQAPRGRRDYGAAKTWFERGIRAGDLDSYAGLGELHDRALGVAKDYGKALHLYQRGASLDNPACMH